MSYTMFADGGSRGNPGPAGSGAVIYKGKEEIAQAGAYLGVATNNVAEYTAIILGLKRALELGISELTVKLDSELAVKQINGQYKVKNAGLKPLFKQVKDLAAQFTKISFSHVYREQNAAADAVVNQFIDEGLGLC